MKKKVAKRRLAGMSEPIKRYDYLLNQRYPEDVQTKNEREILLIGPDNKV